MSRVWESKKRSDVEVEGEIVDDDGDDDDDDDGDDDDDDDNGE